MARPVFSTALSELPSFAGLLGRHHELASGIGEGRRARSDVLRSRELRRRRQHWRPAATRKRECLLHGLSYHRSLLLWRGELQYLLINASRPFDYALHTTAVLDTVQNIITNFGRCVDRLVNARIYLQHCQFFRHQWRNRNFLKQYNVQLMRGSCSPLGAASEFLAVTTFMNIYIYICLRRNKMGYPFLKKWPCLSKGQH